MITYVDKENEDVPDMTWRVWNPFYYIKGKRVMTEYGHASRAKCCSNKCRHCPYHPYASGSDQLREDLKGKLGYRLGPMD